MPDPVDWKVVRDYGPARRIALARGRMNRGAVCAGDRAASPRQTNPAGRFTKAGLTGPMRKLHRARRERAGSKRPCALLRAARFADSLRARALRCLVLAALLPPHCASRDRV